MSAVPKKKLCWNCEGNIVKDIDNCPYCGVYVYSPELDDINSGWNMPYIAEKKTEEIPSPLYQINSEENQSTIVEEKSNNPHQQASIFQQLKNDVFPTLLLMSGSIFFLFGLILFLFSNDGTLTLQWNGNYWPYFLIFSVPCIYLGWKFLLEIEDDPEDL